MELKEIKSAVIGRELFIEDVSVGKVFTVKKVVDQKLYFVVTNPPSGKREERSLFLFRDFELEGIMEGKTVAVGFEETTMRLGEAEISNDKTK